MSDNKPAVRKDRASRLALEGFVAFGVAGCAGLATMLTIAYTMVTSGRGHEAYRTVWGAEFSWIAFLVLIGAAIITLIVGVVICWLESREWKALERKYRKRDEA
jgi:hypothetical protein